ncbi:Ig-like domain-containing protein [Tomitella biformata]|uniref:Ig-like domain-containing protein n=1 Tax=Tomitella biformata TaxID=630403 RepID=UPI0004649FF0|nr:Ig-like domain-containing protein [Tomitella biformata]
MGSKLYRFVAPFAVGATIVSGAALLATSAGADTVTTTTAFMNACQATPSSSLAGGPQTQAQEASVDVQAPDRVSPGEDFDVLITPPPISIANDLGSGASLQNVSRLKIDVAMPANASFLGAEVMPGTSTGLSGKAPGVIVVNDAGSPDPNGTIIRLSGDNETIGNAPGSSKSSEGGIRAVASGSTTTFQLPQVKAKLKAGTTGVVEMKLRTAGNAGLFGNDANFLTFLPKASAPIVGTVWAPTQCSPRDGAGSPLNTGAGALATIEVVRGVTNTVTHLDGPSVVTNGGQFNLNATVVPTPEAGTVQFAMDGVDVGGPVDVVGGKASRTQSLDEDGEYVYTARYSGAEFYNTSVSGDKTVKVSTEDIATTTTVTGPAQDAYRGEPVNLTAKVEPGVSGGTMTFEVGGVSVGTAEVKDDGAAVLPHTFDTNGTHRVVARYSGDTGIAPSSSQQFPVSVTEAPASDVATTAVVDQVGSVAKGAAVTLTARLDPADARGTVQFNLGDQLLGGPVQVVNGVATMTTVFQNPGEFVLTAQYTADSGFIDSAADPVEVTVTGDPDTLPGQPGGGGAGSMDLGSLTSLFGGMS